MYYWNDASQIWKRIYLLPLPNVWVPSAFQGLTWWWPHCLSRHLIPQSKTPSICFRIGITKHSSSSSNVCVFSCVWLCCDPMDCSPPGFSVHGIFQARILEQVAFFFSRRSSWLRDWTHVSCISCISRQILFHCAIWEALKTTQQKVKTELKIELVMNLE